MTHVNIKWRELPILRFDTRLLHITPNRAIAATLVDELALLGRRADAATVAAEGRTAALGLALVVLEHEEAVRAKLHLGAAQRLVRGSVTPLTHTIACLQLHAVKLAHGYIRRLCTSRRAGIIAESLLLFCLKTLRLLLLGLKTLRLLLGHVTHETLARRREYRGSEGHHENIRNNEQT